MKFSRIAFLEPTVDTEVEARPIRAASLPEDFAPAPPRTPPTGPTQPFGDARQDGRLDAVLGEPWAVVWIQRFAAPLLPDTAAHSVLQHGDAILVQAATWQLFDRDGRPRGTGRSGSSPMVISPTDETLRWIDGDGCLAAAPLATGEALWSHGLHHGDGGVYPFLAVVGDRTVSLSTERVINPEALEPPAPTFAVEVVTIEGPVEVSAGGLLRSAKSGGALTAPSVGDAFGAAGDDAIVVAWRDHVATLGFDLSVTRLLKGRFEPRSVSLGDAGRVYMVVRTADGPQLWMLNAAGERVFDAALPDEADETLVPPIVAADHRVFVVTAKRVVAFSPTGEWLWEFAPSQGRPYASVTADGWLLVAVDHSLGIIDTDGTGGQIFSAPGEVFRAAPVLTPAGEILLATERSLIGLRYEPALEVGERTLLR